MILCFFRTKLSLCDAKHRNIGGISLPPLKKPLLKNPPINKKANKMTFISS